MAKPEIQKIINIKNKKASYEFQFLEKVVCGIVLTGTEIKSIRTGKASLQEAHCYIDKEEMWVKKLRIAEYEQGNRYNQDPIRSRKLLLKKKEILKLENKLKDQGLTIIPIRLFLNDRGWAKVEIALAKGKKLHDKRDTIKEKDVKRDLERRGYN